MATNGRVLRVEEGITVLQAARDNQPTHCFLEGLSIAGSIWLCNVDINDRLCTRRQFVSSMIFCRERHAGTICTANNPCKITSFDLPNCQPEYDLHLIQRGFDLNSVFCAYSYPENREIRKAYRDA